MRVFFIKLDRRKKRVWVNVPLFPDFKISASKAQPILFIFQLVQFLPLQHTFLIFYFLFYLSPLISLKSEPFIFTSSCSIVQWIACSPFLIPFGYHACVVHYFSLSLTLSDSFVVGHAALLTEAATNCHHCLANQEFRMPGSGNIESNHACINITHNFLLLSSSWPLYPTTVAHYYYIRIHPLETFPAFD